MKKIGFIAVALATVLLVGCKPTEPEPTVNSVTLDKTKLTLAVGAEEMLKATVDPAGTAVAWASSDNAVAIVTGGGMVSAVAEGTAVITATAGELSGVARVKVIPQVIPATGLAFDKTEAFTISKDDVVTLNAIFTPENTTDKNIEWTSSDTNVLRVVGGGALGTGTSAEVTGFGKGTATITAKSIKHPEVSTTVEITVKDLNTVSYHLEGAYTKNAAIAHRDATVVAEPVSYGFAGNVSRKLAPERRKQKEKE
mgnify:CR=1 FL=1